MDNIATHCCHYSCLTCYSIYVDHCLTCATGLTPDNSNHCCNSSCLSCDSDPDHCLTCASGKTLNSSKHICTGYSGSLGYR